MKILITGGTGFTGQHVAGAYLKAKHEVFVTGREAPVPGAECLGRDFQTLDFDKLPTFDILNHQAAITDPIAPTKTKSCGSASLKPAPCSNRQRATESSESFTHPSQRCAS